ncbi:hypothetical protein ACOME3_003851 [Neoechinorhynchus agilis]
MRISRESMDMQQRLNLADVGSSAKGKSYREIHNLGTRQASRQANYRRITPLYRTTVSPIRRKRRINRNKASAAVGEYTSAGGTVSAATTAGQVPASGVMPLTMNNVREHEIQLQAANVDGFSNSRRYTQHGDGYVLSWVEQQVECHSRRSYSNFSIDHNISGR